MKYLSMAVLVIVVLMNSISISRQLSNCLTCTDGDTAPYHITQPPNNDYVQIVSPDVKNVTVMCSLNITIPDGMIVTWLHNGTIVIVNVLNNNNEGTNNASLKRGQPIASHGGHYQCIFNDTVGHILTRNFTLLILHTPRIIQPLADYHRVTFNESTSSIRLMCSLNITIPSSVTVTWAHDDNIVMSRRPKRITQAGNTTALRIKNPQSSDAGEYQCIFNGLDLQRIILLEFQSSNTISASMIATSMTVGTNTATFISQTITRHFDSTSSIISTNTFINRATTTIITITSDYTADSRSVVIETTSTNSNYVSPTLSVSQTNDSASSSDSSSIKLIVAIVALALIVLQLFIIISIVVMVVYRKRKKNIVQRPTPQPSENELSHDYVNYPNQEVEAPYYSIPVDPNPAYKSRSSILYY